MTSRDEDQVDTMSVLCNNKEDTKKIFSIDVTYSMYSEGLSTTKGIKNIMISHDSNEWKKHNIEYFTHLTKKKDTSFKAIVNVSPGKSFLTQKKDIISNEKVTLSEIYAFVDDMDNCRLHDHDYINCKLEDNYQY